VAQAPPAGRKPAPAPPAPLRPREDPARLAWLRGEAIYNPDAAARSQALEQLAASSDHRLILETALEVLERDRDPRVQQGALDALVELPTIPIEPVLRLVNTSPSTRVRVQALELLSDHRGNEQQVRELLRTLARVDRDQHVRRTAQSLLNDLEND
jgi:HEAT repeat protein